MHSFLKDSELLVDGTSKFDLSSLNTSYTGGLSEKAAKKLLKSNAEDLVDLQRRLYAARKDSVLCVFQAMDAAGKDSTIRAVFSGMNPAGFRVSSFKSPSKTELAHDFLWRCNAALPQRGYIGVFNRSHYEEVLVCKVHPEYVLGQGIPHVKSLADVNADFWSRRYEQIADWEKRLSDSGVRVLKFFLNVSLDEQKARFLSRIENQHKNWKFSFGDLKERALWPGYQEAYQDAISKTSTEDSPWFVIPADNKSIMRAMVSTILKETLESMDLKYPTVNEEDLMDMQKAKKMLSEGA